MHSFNEPQVEWQHSPLDTLLGSTAQALSNTPSFFYELLYNEPVNFQGMKSLFQSITFSVMSYRREKQAERIILCLLILFLVQANLWFLFRFVRFFIGKIWAVVCFLWALCTLFFAFVGFIYRSIDAIFSPSSGNEARKARIITVNESLRD